jgi:hypothetical protein
LDGRIDACVWCGDVVISEEKERLKQKGYLKIKRLYYDSLFLFPNHLSGDNGQIFN